MQASVFAVIAYGYVATAVCVLIGPIFIPWFIVPKMDWLFWGWFKAFIGFSFYQVVAAAFIFIFSKVVVGMFGVIGTLSALEHRYAAARAAGHAGLRLHLRAAQDTGTDWRDPQRTRRHLGQSIGEIMP